ncbi:MAG TPA: hypothetical protein VK879_08110 [Candidatus Sulfomarinibacteraceae bacterium]|nr:hypothetical protein [Candidatus Sulfomarinibacteraceae bacterium]
MARQALFDGLVYDENEKPVVSKLVGDESFYVIDDDGFMRHVESEQVDRQVLQIFLDQLADNKDLAVSEAMRLMGKDDIFTKAALDAQMRNVSAEQIIEQGIPEQARNMLGMLGFRIVINVHGEVVRLDQPTVPDDPM